jgi:hypothetical protein
VANRSGEVFMYNVNSKEGSIQIIQHQRRDLGLLSFNLGVPEQPPAVSGIDVALVRDGRIAVLHTLLTAQG